MGTLIEAFQRDHDLKVIEAMRKHGGGFVKALAEAAFRADSENLAKIKDAWPEYWKQYESFVPKDKIRLR